MMRNCFVFFLLYLCLRIHVPQRGSEAKGTSAWQGLNPLLVCSWVFNAIIQMKEVFYEDAAHCLNCVLIWTVLLQMLVSCIKKSPICLCEHCKACVSQIQMWRDIAWISGRLEALCIASWLKSPFCGSTRLLGILDVFGGFCDPARLDNVRHRFRSFELRQYLHGNM